MELHVGDYLRFRAHPGQIHGGEEMQGLVIHCVPPRNTQNTRPALGTPIRPVWAWVWTIQPWEVFSHEERRHIRPAISFSEDEVTILDHVLGHPSLATALSLGCAAQQCDALYTLVPFPNEWEGPGREQLIFGKGLVAGAKACAAMFRRLAGQPTPGGVSHSYAVSL